MAKFDALKEVVAYLYSKGVCEPRILAEQLKHPLRTIQHWVSLLKSGRRLQRKPGSGRPFKLSSNDRRRLLGLTAAHPRLSATRLATEMGKRGSPHVSRQSVYRELRRSGLEWRKPQIGTLLTSEGQAKRLAWCLKYRGFD